MREKERQIEEKGEGGGGVEGEGEGGRRGWREGVDVNAEGEGEE